MAELALLALGSCTAGFAGAYFVTPLTARVARRYGVLDQVDESHGYKGQREPVPYLGGVAIFLGLGVGAGLPAILVAVRLPDTFTDVYLPAIGIALALAIVGLVDDLRGVPRLLRLALEIAAAATAWAFGFKVTGTSVPVLDFALTMLWIVGITNAFNLLDNMDGLSAGLAAVGALGFAAMAVLEELSVLSLVAAAIAGAAAGFLAHNRHPAKIFMGDAGSLPLGFLLAVIGIRLRFDNLPEVTFLVPVVVLGIPIFDTTLVVLSRIRHGRSVFKGGRDHASHRLVAIGFPVRTAVGLLYWAGLCLAWLGLVISRANVEVGWMLLGFVVVLGSFFGRLLWRVPVYDSSPIAHEADDTRTITG